MRNLLKRVIIATLILAAGTGLVFASSQIAFQQSYPVTAVYGVKLDLMSEQVEIALWNRNEFRVTVVSAYGDYPVPELSGGILSCVDKTGGNRHKCTVEIKVPESFFARAAYGGWSISTMSGSVDASKLWGEAIYIETMSGAISLHKCEAQIMDVSSSSGKITLSQCIASSVANLESATGAIMFDGIAAGLNVETTTGAVNASLDQPPVQDCNFETTTGAITVSLPENPGFKLVFDTTTGSVYNSFTGYQGKKSGIDTYGAGYVIIRAESGTGSIRILRK